MTCVHPANPQNTPSPQLRPWDRLVGGHLAVRLDAVLEAEELPASIADLHAALPAALVAPKPTAPAPNPQMPESQCEFSHSEEAHPKPRSLKPKARNLNA